MLLGKAETVLCIENFPPPPLREQPTEAPVLDGYQPGSGGTSGDSTLSVIP